ncbi:OmpA family protein [soil metagenome]
MNVIKQLALVSLTVCLSCVALSAEGADKQGAKDYPSITRFTGSEIVDYQVVDFDEATLVGKAIAKSPIPADALLKVEGKVTRIAYRMPAGKTAVEVMRNYEQALGSGYTTVFKCAANDCGDELAGYVGNGGAIIPSGWDATFHTEKNRYWLARRSAPEGDRYVLLYVMESGNNNPTSVYQEVVDVKPMQGGQVSVIDAASLKRGLDSEGKIAVYGIYFDNGQAVVKPDSKPTLDEMAKLLATTPALKVYIVGHTDNVGTLAANLDLSQQRADAVVKALTTTYKVVGDRLVAKGVASLAPVASNADDAGRARNRRVELVVR